MKVLRKTLTGVSTEFSFNVTGLKFLVKNFSEGPVLVNFEPITAANEATSIKVPANVAQLIFTNEYQPNTKRARTLYVKGTGEVEVQVVCY